MQKLKKSNDFDIHSFYNDLRDKSPLIFIHSLERHYGCKSPTEGLFFCVWTAAQGKILPCDNLIKTGYTLVGWCFMCQCSWETVDHLLTHCVVARNPWRFFFFMCFGIHWVPQGKVMDVMFGRRNWVGKHSSAIWNMVPFCLMWTIWREHNHHTFEDVECTRSRLLATFSSS